MGIGGMMKIKENRTVDRPKVGSVVFCGMYVVMEHSGVYVGKDKIVSLSKDGVVVKETPEEFRSGITTGLTIYVSSKGKKPVGDKVAAKRARKKVGKSRDYNLVLDNCHILPIDQYFRGL